MTPGRPGPAGQAEAAPRLVCLPHAGGSASTFGGWRTALAGHAEVVGIDLPARGRRFAEPPPTCIAAVVDTLTRGVHRPPDRPVLLFGHSLGALIGFELTRRLVADGLTPARLIVAGHRAPHLPDRHPPVHELPDADLLQHLSLYGGLLPAVLANAELMHLMLPALRADLALAETYRYVPAPPLPCPISVFGGVDDPLVNGPELAAWRDHTSADCEIRLLPGDHFFVRHAERALLDAIAADVALDTAALRAPAGRRDRGAD